MTTALSHIEIGLNMAAKFAPQKRAIFESSKRLARESYACLRKLTLEKKKEAIDLATTLIDEEFPKSCVSAMKLPPAKIKKFAALLGSFADHESDVLLASASLIGSATAIPSETRHEVFETLCTALQ